MSRFRYEYVLALEIDEADSAEFETKLKALVNERDLDGEVEQTDCTPLDENEDEDSGGTVAD